MFWPVILPFFITCFVLPAVVVGFTIAAPRLKWRSARTFLFASLLAFVGFIPSCTCIMVAVDLVRFGTFYHATHSDMWNDRYKLRIPASAKDIVIHKDYGGNGFRARYRISETEFHASLNEVWKSWDEYHSGPSQRGKYGEQGRPADGETFAVYFGDLGWKPWGVAEVYDGPHGGNGAGSTYYYDLEAGVAYQVTGFW